MANRVPPDPAKDVKSPRGISLYSLFVNRPTGRLLALAAHRWGLTANAMTVISALSTFTGIALLAAVEPSWGSGIGTAGLLVVGFACDSADGQLARLAGTSSPAGEWLDHIVDAAKMVALHAAVLIGWYRFVPLADRWLLVPLAFQFVAVVTFSGLTTVSLLKQQQTARRPMSAHPSRIRALGLLPADYGTLAWCFVLWGSVSVFRITYLVLMVMNAVIMAGFLVKWFFELRGGNESIDT